MSSSAGSLSPHTGTSTPARPGSDVTISIRNISKNYTIAHNRVRATSLLEAASERLRKPFARPETETFWALRDVSFDVRRGEVVGVIGRNGAGKSTLFKILSRITAPTSGEADLYGRVGSLLEVGTGFHRELTGRENIFLNGSILGMNRREIARNFDAIVDFAGVEKFLDTPVKRYSSGMYVRLAFAVAAHLNPEILIVDEVLAVGDAEFQKKCLGKMSEVSRQGRTVLFVSHNMTAVLNLCQRGILLEGGRIVCDDRIEAVVDRYLAHGDKTDTFRPKTAVRSGNARARIERFHVSPNPPQTGMPLEFNFEVVRDETDTGTLTVEPAVSVLTERQQKLFQLYARHVGVEFALPPGRSRITARIDSLPLTPGSYRLNLWLGSGQAAVDFLEDCYTLTVAPGSLDGSTFVENRGYPVVVPSEWSAEGEPVALPVGEDR